MPGLRIRPGAIKNGVLKGKMEAGKRLYTADLAVRGNAPILSGLHSFDESLQLSRPRRMSELAQRFRLDLADALARHREVLAHLFQRVLAAVRPQPESHLDHLFLARRERFQN